MIQWVSWTELYKIRIITYTFLKPYTIAKYHEWKIDVEMEPDEICKVVGDLATLIGGKDLENIQLMMSLILKPGLSFWRLRTKASNTTIEVGT
jgi:hypothetical protein